MQAVERIFSVLQLFDDAERPLGLVEIQRQLGYPESSLAAMLSALATAGYLRHDRSTRTYAPTIRLAHLAGWVKSRAAPIPAIDKAMAEIRERTGETVGLGYRNDIRIQYLRFVDGTHPPTHGVKEGTTRLLCRSGLGWALMSFLSRRAIDSIVRRTNRSVAAEDMIDAESINLVVEQCRQAGYVFAQHTVRVGYGVIAAPLYSQLEQYAVGVHAPVSTLAERESEISGVLRDVLARLVV